MVGSIKWPSSTPLDPASQSFPLKHHFHQGFNRSIAMLSSTFRQATSAIRPTLLRAFATGPASGGSVTDEQLKKLGSLSTQALVDGLWVMGWPSAQIDGARPLAPGMKCVGRAVTLRFVPARPDIAADKPPGGNSPEYEAFELCGPNEVGCYVKGSSVGVALGFLIMVA